MSTTDFHGRVIVQQVKKVYTAANQADLETAGHVLGTICVPGDAIMLDATVWSGDLDSNGTPALTLDVYLQQNGSDVMPFIAGSTIGQASGFVQWLGGAGYAPFPLADMGITAPEVDIVLRVGTGAATGDDGTVYFTVTYTR